MFKKVIVAAFAYLIIGGVLSGAAIVSASKRCGPIAGVNGYAQTVLLWPAVIATALVTVPFDVKFTDTCKSL